MKKSFENKISKLRVKIERLFNDPTQVDKHQLIEELEDTLLESDIGIKATNQIIESLVAKCNFSGSDTKETVTTVLSNEILSILKPFERPLNVIQVMPTIILLIGVNGSGKTTTAGKLANRFKNKDLSVLLGAADTFRAAGTAQIIRWGEKISIDVVSAKDGDPATVTYKTIKKSIDRNIDVTIIDTAGRLPNQPNLMKELEKIKKVAEQNRHQANLITLLTIDANTGQNSISQVNTFSDKIGVDGLILTKLDGSAKGGSLVAIAKENGPPIYFIGTGEKIDDLKSFDADEFVADFLK